MAIMLGLTYYANIILANLLSTEDILYMEKIAGTFFRIQLLLIQGILSDDLGLIVSIISENTYTRKYISDFLAEADRLRNIIDARKGNEFMRDLANVKSIFQQEQRFAYVLSATICYFYKPERKKVVYLSCSLDYSS